MKPESAVFPGAGVGVTGATGMVGKEVCRVLEEEGYRVVRFSRSPQSWTGPGEVRPFALDKTPDLSGLEAVVHLAGESIHGLWTRKKMAAIRSSRIEGTRRILDGLRRAGSVRVLLNASAIGFYGLNVQGDASHPLTESHPGGTGFLPEVCQAWESEATRAAELGCRVIPLRIGMVLGHGGALALMGPIFRLGLGGRIGSGRQWIPPIHVTDLALACSFLLREASLAGPVNLVQPHPVTNTEFTREVARVVRRPAPWVVPAWALRLALGGLADLLLGSLPVVPSRLAESGYVFRFPTLRAALEDVLQK